MIEFEPCPFCGNNFVYLTYNQEYSLGSKEPIIFCDTCKAIFSVEDDSPYTDLKKDYEYRKQKTIEKWNTRIKPKHAYWILHDNGSATCSACKCWQMLIYDDDNYQHYCGNCGAQMEVEKLNV